MSAECATVALKANHKHHPLALRLQCRKEWVEGQGTLSQIAGRHSVPPQTLVAWYRRDNWTAARDRWREKQLCNNDATTKPPAMPPIPESSTEDSRASKLQRLELQLEALDNLIDNAKTADDWHKLSTAKHRLLENWYVLAGIPKPGSLKHKPAREPRRSTYYDCEPRPMPAPIEAVRAPMPTPVESPAGGVAPVGQPAPAKTEPVPIVPASLPVPKAPEVRPAEVPPVPSPQVGQEIGYGVELAPGVWKETPRPPKPDLQAWHKAPEEAARLRLLRQRTQRASG